MKRLLAGLLLVAATAGLSGCYYDPGYSYVRGGSSAGDAYYGSGGSVVYDDGGYYPGYWYPSYGYGGCCYGPGINVWYGHTYYRGYRGGGPGYWHGGRGGWYGHGGGNWHGGGHWSGGHGGGGHWGGGGHGGGGGHWR
ncbi:hypothetical protein [Dyella sp.]|uniref:hypothetical protein n=1 Tax=Dyella sp. TaxID=1869338 RepID=UPI002ED11CB3